MFKSCTTTYLNSPENGYVVFLKPSFKFILELVCPNTHSFWKFWETVFNMYLASGNPLMSTYGRQVSIENIILNLQRNAPLNLNSLPREDKL